MLRNWFVKLTYLIDKITSMLEKTIICAKYVEFGMKSFTISIIDIIISLILCMIIYDTRIFMILIDVHIYAYIYPTRLGLYTN